MNYFLTIKWYMKDWQNILTFSFKQLENYMRL